MTLKSIRLAVIAAGLLLPGSLRSQTQQPNVLLIGVDDLNDWVGVLGGHPQTLTPNIDRLAARGMLFSNAHCQGTMCNPSRISLLWGRRPSSTGFYDNHYQIENEPAFLNAHTSLPAYFAANGYKTLTTGKIFHDGTLGQSQVNGPRPGQWRNGFDQPIHQDPQWHSIWDFGPQDYDETEFVDHIVASWAVTELGKDHGSPFFLATGFYRPHVPFFPPRRIYDALPSIQRPPVDLNDWDDIPNAADLLTRSNPKIPTHDWMLQEGRWDLAVRAYLGCIRWTDEQIGRLLDALDAGPNAENTIIILFSDHGYHLGEKQRWSKFSLWERTTRIPLIISVPDGMTGTSGKSAELLSIYPTLVDLCGLPPNPQLEGVSLRPLLEDPNAAWPHVAISTLGQGNHAIRDERWRYIRYAGGSEELYDHQNDPNEWVNLAAGNPEPEHAAVIASLSEHLPETNVPQRGSAGSGGVTLDEGIVLDDPAAVLAGTWGASTNLTPYVGDGYRFIGASGTQNDGSATASFRFTAPEAGVYRFYLAYSPDPTRANNVPVTVTSGPHVTDLTVDQTVARLANSAVREVGTVHLVADEESVITIGTAGTTGFVILDAVQLIREKPDGPPADDTYSFREGVSPAGAYTHDAVYVRLNAPDDSFNDDPDRELIVGTTASGDVLRTLLAFDLGTLSPGAVVTSATLELTTHSTGGLDQGGEPGNPTFHLHPFESDFTEGNATWNNLGMSGTTLGTPLSSVSFDPTLSGENIVFGSTTEFSDAVEQALAGDGILRLIVSKSDESTAGTHEFARFHDESATTPTDRPELRISMGSTTFVITSFSHSSASGEVTLSWPSQSGETYRVAWSPDLSDWTGSLASDIEPDIGAITTRTFDLAAAGIAAESRVFLRVEK